MSKGQTLHKVTALFHTVAVVNAEKPFLEDWLAYLHVKASAIIFHIVSCLSPLPHFKYLEEK